MRWFAIGCAVKSAAPCPARLEIWGAFLDFMAWDFDRLTAMGYSKADIKRVPTSELLAHMTLWISSI